MSRPHIQQPAIPLSVRISPTALDQLNDLADATGRTKSFLAAEAIENYLANQAWQIKAIKKTLKKANGKKAKFIDHDKVVSWLNTWGTSKEQEPPK